MINPLISFLLNFCELHITNFGTVIMVNIKLKWNKLTFDCNVGESTEAFKSNIFQLTGVPVDRQKLMAKGAWIGI